MDAKVTKIFLWTAPRCVSTAFERSIIELQKSKVFHEPFSKAYYYGSERRSQRFAKRETEPNGTYKDICAILQQNYEGKDIIFSKDMAYYIDDCLQNFLQKEFEGFQHTFLIRTPKKAIPSLHKASIDVALTGYDYFDPFEAGYKSLYDLYNFVVEHICDSPIVVDADDLLDDPEGTMKSYCKATGLPFDIKMLNWEAGEIAEWTIWKGWHDDVLKSTGFRRRDNAREKIKRDNIDISVFPVEVQKSIKFSMEYYEKLYQYRLKPITDTQ